MAAVSLLKGVCTLREEDQLFDFTIEVEDEQFRVHKVVMASVSDYFKVMLTGSLAESQSDRVRLQELSSLVVSNMIEFIYTGQFGSTTASTEDLLACAVYLQMPAAIEECTKLLVGKVNIQNCFDMLAMLKTYSVGDGVDQVTQFIKSNIDVVMQVNSSEMSFREVQSFMEFWQKSEWELFLCVLEWGEEHANRGQHLKYLLSCVRFALMTHTELTGIKQSDIYAECDGLWRDLVGAAEAFHNLPTHRRVLDESEQSRVRSHPVPICYTANETLSSVFYSLHDGKSWKMHEAQLAPPLYDRVAAHITVNNYLIVCDSHFDDIEKETFIQGWHIFDPRTSAWSHMAPLNVARDNFAVFHHQNHLYALGGRTESGCQVTDAIERYNFEADRWEVIPTKLPVPRQGHGACVIGDHVYVAGGYKDSLLKRNDRLNLSTNTWQSRAPMSINRGLRSPVDKIQVMELWGEEVLFIFDRTFAMHYYSPSADQWSKWDCLSHMDSDFVHFFCPHVIADQNVLFLHSFACSAKQNVTDSSYRQARWSRVCPEPGEGVGCVKWTVGGMGERITEVKLEDYPVDVAVHVNEEGDIDPSPDTPFTALLAIPPQHLRRPKKISTGPGMPQE